MKAPDIIILLLCGLFLWMVGTIYFAYRGTVVLETTSLRYWISFLILPVFTAAVCIGVLRLREIPAVEWTAAMLLLAIPGMIGEALILSHFATFMPKLQETSAGRYGAILFATYAVVLGIAEVVTLRAKL